MNKELINEKRKKLLQAGENLKKQFIGLDSVIDKIISLIEVWYIIPDLLSTPLIINLWGMTGVGKTDLVRKLVKELNFEDKFLEIQLNTDSSDKNIQDEIIETNITPDSQGIILLDEIQRFRTIDEEHKSNRNINYSDIWELLSDGSFSSSSREIHELQMFLLNLFYSKDWKNFRESNPDNELDEDIMDVLSNQETTKVKRKYTNDSWNAKKFKEVTKIESNVEEIMSFDLETQIHIIEDRIKKLKTKKEVTKYKKLLIFISGNLDEAYRMADNVTDIDTDADIIHEKTKSINILDIKYNLSSRFTPEQIARLGNNHILYLSLSKQNFKDLISSKLKLIVEKFYEITKIKINFSESINEVVYSNGVFPVQGVRPVFSTINSLVENSLPEFLLKAIEDNIFEINIYSDQKKNLIMCSYIKDGNEIQHKRDVSFEIDKIRKKTTENCNALSTVHEVGHSVAYMLLFNTVPKQICGSSVGVDNGAFIISHKFVSSRENLLNFVKVLLAGKVAEELIFGNRNTTSGAVSDIQQATQIVSSMVRNNNMTDKFFGCILPTTHTHVYMTNHEDTNDEINNILKKEKGRITDLLKSKLNLMKLLLKEVLEKKCILANEIFEIISKSNEIPNLKLIPFDEGIEPNYAEMLNTFLRRKMIDKVNIQLQK